MHASRATLAPISSEIRYQDYLSKQWVCCHAPCRWRGNVELRFRSIAYRELEPAGSCKHIEILAKWLGKLQRRKPLPPLIVCATEHATFYIRDGNHRHEAIGLFLGAGVEDATIRVAEVVPKPGYCFRYRWFGKYGTYLLEPNPITLSRPDACFQAISAPASLFLIPDSRATTQWPARLARNQGGEIQW